MTPSPSPPAPPPSALPATPPGPGFEEPFDLLSACHERVVRMLELLLRLASHLDSAGRQGADEPARQAASDLMRYFDVAAPLHHQDEELHVLPVLERSAADEHRALAARLRAEHQLVDAAWTRIRPGLAELADGRWSGAAAAREFESWQAFVALYHGHLRAEDEAAFPVAATHIDDAGRAAMGAEMARRRGVTR